MGAFKNPVKIIQINFYRMVWFLET
jgi:hypothetical protein